MALRSSQSIAALVLLAAIAIGTAIDRQIARDRVRSGDYLILSGDFHVHAFPGDGSLTPALLRDEAKRAGLDVITITNHNQFLASRMAERLPPSADEPIVIPGQEVTNPGYHLIAVGIRDVVPATLSVPDAVAAIHAQGGVAIAAHPARAFAGYSGDAIASLDGTEVAHPEYLDEYRRQYVEAFARAKRLHPHVAPIGSSDIHNTPALGLCRTYLFVRDRSVAGVLDAIRNGRTVASDERGQLYGDAALVERVRAAKVPGRIDPHPWWRRLSIALAWIGVAALVVF